LSLNADCDRDAVLIRVRPRGPACHTGAPSCFFGEVEGFASASGRGIGSILAELETVLEQRRLDAPEGSYAGSLFPQGLKQIVQKVGEEAAETVIAALSGEREETIRESADLIFHLVVALRALDIPLEAIADELRSRRK